MKKFLCVALCISVLITVIGIGFFKIENQRSTNIKGINFESLENSNNITKDNIKDITKKDDEIIFTVEARSFIYHQVRNMVGTLKEVGEGKLKPEDVKIILDAKDRTKAGISAPAHGLYLNKVVY